MMAKKEPRYHALDCLRAAAMLLGVIYHAIQANMFSERGMTPSFISAFVAMEFMHCFRMPLFFLISGFFCALMYAKYRLGTYLVKRWWRIFTPMLLAIAFFGTLHAYLKPPAPMNLGPLVELWEEHGPGQPPKPLPTELLPHDLDGDGSLSKAEWRKVFAGEARKQTGPPPDQRVDPSSTNHPAPFEAPSFSDEGLDLTDLLPRVGPLAKTLFGASARYFTLGHLWFLWYLLVFATIGPFVALAAGRLFRNADVAGLHATGNGPLAGKAIASRFFPLLLGLISIPAIMQTRGLFGWSLGMAEGIFVTFPDVLFQLQMDWPFYFLYFMAGWLVYRQRTSLPSATGIWLPCLLAGTFCFFASLAFSGIYSKQVDHPLFSLLRLTGYAISSLATSLLVWGFLGLFQRYLDHPSGVVRYLANTAFWIYLVHQELLPPAIKWLAPLDLSFWPLVILSSAIATGVSLVLYELFIRPTPLVHLFGVAASGKPPLDAKAKPLA